MLICTVCSTPLSGLQKKFCSRKCLNKCHEQHSYEAQQRRGKKRKVQLIKDKGGKCEICGYNKCLAGLVFHHTDPTLKKFQLDIRSLSNRSWKLIEEEAKICMLLCHNCHIEIHHPEPLIL